MTRADVMKFHRSMRSSPYAANRALSVLSKMFNLAEDWGMRPEWSNPCRRVKRYPEKARDRFLTDDELRRLGEVLRESEQIGNVVPAVIRAVWLLALTGCRASEVLNLRWDDVDFEAGLLSIRNGKTGDRPHSVGGIALAYINQLPRQDGHDFVIGRPVSVNLLDKSWRRIRGRAGLDDCRVHDLRHTVGTYAGQAGANAFLVRDKLGHKTLAMTGRYVERDADPLRALSDRVEGRVAAAMWRKLGEVVPIAPGAE